MDNFIIGNSTTSNPCWLKFHQYKIYDNVNWTDSGHLVWNAIDKQFEVIPDEDIANYLIEKKRKEELLKEEAKKTDKPKKISFKKPQL